MTLDTQIPDGQRGFLSSPDLKLRDSKAIWGPLQISIHCHRQSTELGYLAGDDAYQNIVRRHGQGAISLDMLEHYMNCYLTIPRYRPRVLTEKIATEWRAMFVLGWTHQMLADLAHRRPDEQSILSYQQREARG